MAIEAPTPFQTQEWSINGTFTVAISGPNRGCYRISLYEGTNQLASQKVPNTKAVFDRSVFRTCRGTIHAALYYSNSAEDQRIAVICVDTDTKKLAACAMAEFSDKTLTSLIG